MKPDVGEARVFDEGVCSYPSCENPRSDTSSECDAHRAGSRKRKLLSKRRRNEKRGRLKQCIRCGAKRTGYKYCAGCGVPSARSNVELRAELYEKQDGRCAICCVKFPPIEERLPGGSPVAICMDHCHRTGRIRGLLCSFCNKAIGLLRDDPENARAAAAYLDTKPP